MLLPTPQPESEDEKKMDSTMLVVKSGPPPIAADHMMTFSESGEAKGEEQASVGNPAPLDIMSVLQRDKWVIVVLFLIVSAITIPVIWLKVAPTYRATALVRVSPVVSRIVFKTEDNGIVPLFWSYLNTQVSIIQSSRVLQHVLEREDVRRTDWYRSHTSYAPDGPTAPRLADFDPILSVEARPKSELIEVSTIIDSAKDTTVIANAVVNEYKAVTEASLSAMDSSRLETLISERKSLRRSIDNLVETRFQLSKKRELGTGDPGDLRSQLSVQRSNLESEKEATKREALLTEWELRMIRSAAQKQDIEETDSVREKSAASLQYSLDVEWRRINSQLEADLHDLELGRQRYGERHPRIEALVSTVQHDRELLHQRERQLNQGSTFAPSQTLSSDPAIPESAAGRNPKTLEWLREKQMQDLKLRQDEIEKLDMKMEKIGNLAQKLSQLDEEIRQKREIYGTVRNRLTELELESKAPARVSIAAYAQQPVYPYHDKRAKLTVAALGVALIMGVVVALLRARFNSKIEDSADVMGNVRVPFLGQLLEFPSSLDLCSCSNSSVLEGMRMVRTALLKRIQNTGQRIILVTSSSSDCGKTSASILLGRSLATLGKKTLLVETDLRRPSLCERLNMESTAGLSLLLTGARTDTQCISPTVIPHFDVITAGEVPYDFDYELLANGNFSACLKRWRHQYDFILLDSPPVLQVADARILAGQADGVIMILRASHSRRGEVVQAYADLSAAGGTLLGTILLSAHPYGGRGYYNYSYGPDVRQLVSKTQV